MTKHKIMAELEKEYPTLARKVVDVERIGDFEIKCICDDGSSVWYDCMEHAINGHRSVNACKEIELDDSEETWLKIFSAKLNKRMDEVAYGQAYLSELTGISQPLMYRYIHGLSVPSARNIQKIAIALRCSVDELINF